MSWHRTHSLHASYTADDAGASRPVCRACVYGSMHQANTNHRREHRPQPTIPGQQFVLDAYTNTTRSYRNYKHCDLLTDQATGQVYSIFTKNRSVEELCERIGVFFDMHPAWHTSTSPSTPRYVRIDPENNYKSEEFLRLMAQYKYYIEHSPTRDKHAQGLAERSIGIIATKTNIAMLAPTPAVPLKYWCLAMSYACITMSFNPSTRLNDSPYHYTTGKHIDINNLHQFWERVYVHIPLKDRGGKVGFPRAYQGHFVGYLYTSTLFDNFIILTVLPDGRYGKIRHSKDVIFDSTIDFKDPDPNKFPSDEDFFPVDLTPLPLVLNDSPTDELDEDNAVVEEPTPQPAVPQPPPAPAPPVTHASYKQIDASNHIDNNLGSDQIPSHPDAVYWYSTFFDDHEYTYSMVETSHADLAINIRDPAVPKTFWSALRQPDWAAAINKERTKFELNNCLAEVPYTGQHLVPMMWLFNIKTDGTKKARLVGRGDMMIPWVDFDPNAVYCGNVSSSSIKIALTIAANYKLIMRGGDLVGAYLVTLANPDYPVYIQVPQGYTIGPGMCIQAVGNLYGFPPAGQNFSKEFDKCVNECGYTNTPWDPKLFIKWIKGKPIIVIAHSDDFRWFGPPDMINEWDILVLTFNKHRYEVTDATNKEFVGIHIYHDNDFNYYMDQERMITSIVKEANISGAKDAYIPYPLDGPALSKADCPTTEEEKRECQKYPYRRVVGQLMYGMVHTMVTIMYALNVLTRYGTNPGPRHIAFLKHLLQYCKYAKGDRLKFTTHSGPYDLKTMTARLQLKFQCDADLGGNLDNYHSQTSYLGYLAGSLICWCSTDQGSVSTSTAESEIKAVNHTLKCEVIANRGMLDMMGWKQEPTVIEEDNSACVLASASTQITRGLRHLPLAENWFKEKVADGTCIIVKVPTTENNADIGTKRLARPIFTKLTYALVDKTLSSHK
jgi:Reverse transcriptase (RNA-dependent DNA polymerase)